MSFLSSTLHTSTLQMAFPIHRSSNLRRDSSCYTWFRVKIYFLTSIKKLRQKWSRPFLIVWTRNFTSQMLRFIIILFQNELKGVINHLCHQIQDKTISINFWKDRKKWGPLLYWTNIVWTHFQHRLYNWSSWQKLWLDIYTLRGKKNVPRASETY